jgi:hypothetical protein
MRGNLTPQLKRILMQAGCTFQRQGKGDHEPLCYLSVIPSKLRTRFAGCSTTGATPGPRS